MYETTGRAVIKVNKKGKQYQGVKTSRYASPELTHFKKQCTSFYNLNFKVIDSISSKIKEWIAQGYVIRLDAYVSFERSRIFTLDNNPKQIDADNRRKALQDSLSEMLGIDDKMIFSGIMEKVTCESKQDEQCVVNFTPMKPRTLNEIKSLKG